MPWRRSDETRALDEVSLTIEAGTIAVLLGPNGSGKTTLLKSISTMLLPDSGKVKVAGHDTEDDDDSVRRMIGFAVGSERSFFPRLTARENLRFFATLEDLAATTIGTRVEEVLEAVGLAPDGDKQVMKYSSGMLHRLGVARAMLKHPPVLLLDEPSRSLDPAASEQLWRMLRTLGDSGTTIVVASHNFEETAAIADVVAVLDRGRMVGKRSFSPPREAKAVRDFYFSLSPQSTATRPSMAEARL
jgi:ABC-2 type transport system ATP-binding protein